MDSRSKRGGLVAIASVGAAALLAGCSNSTGPSSPASAPTSAAAGVIANSQQTGETLDRLLAPPGWTISLWAVGGAKYSNPDAIDIDGQNIWIGYQNASVKDGSDNSKASTIVEYTLTGSVVKTWSVPGTPTACASTPPTTRCGSPPTRMRRPSLNIIDPASATPTSYTLAPTAHGGGYDDLAFINGTAFVACSNPTLDANGNNVFPAIDKLTLSGTSATVAPVLMGNAAATDAVAGKPTTLNLTDPDSFTIDPKGNLVLVSQADSALITIANPVRPTSRSPRRRWATSRTTPCTRRPTPVGFFVVDAGKNATYTMKWSGPKGSVFTEAPNDSGVVELRRHHRHDHRLHHAADHRLEQAHRPDLRPGAVGRAPFNEVPANFSNPQEKAEAHLRHRLQAGASRTEQKGFDVTTEGRPR